MDTGVSRAFTETNCDVGQSQRPVVVGRDLVTDLSELRERHQEISAEELDYGEPPVRWRPVVIEPVTSSSRQRRT